MNCILRLLIVLLALSPAVFAADLSGRVIGIADGDTFRLLTSDKQQVKIRLAEIDAPEGCVIKGNINSKGDKIYHVPGMSSYGATKIDESKGERWFCSEEEAIQAGWRAPRN